MSLAGNVVQILYIGDATPSYYNDAGMPEHKITEAEIHLDGEYGLVAQTIINPEPDMDILMHQFLWGDAAWVFIGQDRFARRMTQKEWQVVDNWRDLAKAYQKAFTDINHVPHRPKYKKLRAINMDS